MKLVALSGGIASGKSTIAARLAELGAAHIDADGLAREVVEPGTPALARLRERFGEEVIRSEGSLDRAALARRVFGDPGALAELNGIVHPAVRALAARRIAEIGTARPDAIVIYDVPLLVEGRVDQDWDLIVIAEAPDDLRLRRLVELRGLPEDEARKRIASQASNEERRAVADVVIDTGGSLEQTLDQVDALWERLSV
ncbi:dephospho-CoA kinase [Leucobacter weissii]|uniref:Dephospho-CoA kinase n=1 Tax=Leucobacter weissii TaxID=1983706 RepID=A0A939MJ71_9MICO|nr:dephospho-CoA kinase [Leucobacter weissii]MBO1901934.1 dephospho-CoA kinase [Leucobacter weissii]